MTGSGNAADRHGMIDMHFVGHEMPPLTVEVDKTMIRRFAHAIGEDDPVHYDEAAARAAGYPSLPAPLTFPIVLKSMAMTDPGGATIMTDALAMMGIAPINMLHGEQDIVAHRPVCAGETVTLRCRIESIDNKPDKRMTIFRERTLVTAADGSLIAETSAAYIVRHPGGD